MTFILSAPYLNYYEFLCLQFRGVTREVYHVHLKLYFVSVSQFLMGQILKLDFISRIEILNILYGNADARWGKGSEYRLLGKAEHNQISM